MANQLLKIDLERALFDPASVFAEPDDVVEHPSLTITHKIEILRRWAYDASELVVAEDEGMVGYEGPAIGEILAALHRLTGGYDAEHTPPTKHVTPCGSGGMNGTNGPGVPH